MTNEQVYFLQAMSDFINKKEPQMLPPFIKWGELERYGKIHSLLPILQYQCDKKSKEFYAQMMRYVKMGVEMNSIKSLFSELPYALEKGSGIYEVYPIPALRTMGDIDILISVKSIERGRQLLSGAGYINKSGDGVEYIKGDNIVELHEQPMHDFFGNERIAKYFLNWEDYSIEHKLTLDYHVLVLIFHLRQHLLSGGVGFRQFMDIAVITLNKNIDWEWILNEAEKLYSADFVKTVLALNERWFHVKSPVNFAVDDRFYNDATEAIFENGVFGRENTDNKRNPIPRIAINQGVNLNIAKFRYYKEQLLPSYNTFLKRPDCPKYLRKHRAFIPIAWLQRLCSRIKDKEKRDITIHRLISANSGIQEREAYYKQWGL